MLLHVVLVVLGCCCQSIRCNDSAEVQLFETSPHTSSEEHNATLAISSEGHNATPATVKSVTRMNSTFEELFAISATLDLLEQQHSRPNGTADHAASLEARYPSPAGLTCLLAVRRRILRTYQPFFEGFRQVSPLASD